MARKPTRPTATAKTNPAGLENTEADLLPENSNATRVSQLTVHRNLDAEVTDRVKRLVAAGAVVDIVIPETLADQKAEAAALFQRIDTEGAQLGFLLLTIRAQMAHGEWAGWLASAGIEVRNAQRHMQVANLLAGIGNSNRPRVADLPHRRKLALAALGPEAVDALIESGDFDTIVDLPDKQFQVQLKEIKRLGDQVQKLSDRVNQLDEGQLDKRRRSNAMPLLVQQCRQESAVVADMVGENLDSLERLARDLVVGQGLSSQNEERQAQLRAAAGPLYLQIMAVAARAQAIANSLRDDLGDEYVPVEVAPLLGQEEIQSVLERKALLMPGFVQRRAEKQMAAVSGVARRGRPRKAG